MELASYKKLNEAVNTMEIGQIVQGSSGTIYQINDFNGNLANCTILELNYSHFSMSKIGDIIPRIPIKNLFILSNKEIHKIKTRLAGNSL